MTTVTRAGTTGAAPSLEELYDAHRRRLLRLGTLLLGDAARAEDVVQDVFVALHRRGTADLEEPAAYLTRAVVNGARSAGRRLSLARRHEERPPVVQEAPDDDLAASERRREVLDALATLPRRQREVLALRYYLDLPEREIARVLDISPGAVKTHASRAAAALRERLDPSRQETR